METGVPSWAVPGAKVVCVRTYEYYHHAGRPVAGQVYTLREFGSINEVSVEELRAPDLRGPYWLLSRFRPLVTSTLESDISVHFAHHLHVQENAPA